MSSSANYLAGKPGCQLAIATTYNGKDLWRKKIGTVVFYLLPCSSKHMYYDKGLEMYWKNVKEQFQPDVVHIHGSEYPYGLAYVNACGSQGVVLSIQGMMSVYANYYYGGLSCWNIIKNTTLSDIVLRRGLIFGKKEYEKKGEMEIELIKKINHVIGRTSWDKLHSQSINHSIRYYFCNETLRPSFYDGQWVYENCQKHTIFVPQAWYPIKGLHQILKAIPTIRDRYPDVKLRVAGANIVKYDSIKDAFFLTGYGKIIRNIIKNHNLEDCVQFTGLLDENGMKQEYLNANLFVCPSSIENSPNSLGEAQLLGTPCLSAYVGGVSDMITHGKDGYIYRFDDIEMLSEYVCYLFSLGREIQSLSENEKKVAMIRHDGENNVNRLMSIYESIYGGCK